MIGESHRLIHSCVLHDRGMSKHVQICRATVVRTIFNSASLTGSSCFRRDCVHFKVRLQNNVRYAWKEIFLLITTPVALLVMHEANISSGRPQTSANCGLRQRLFSRQLRPGIWKLFKGLIQGPDRLKRRGYWDGSKRRQPP